MINTKGRVLVTGADGFIGSHLAESLVLGGFKVRAFVHYNSFGSWGWLDHCSEEIRSNLDVVMGDVRDPDRVRYAARGCDTIMHLAALIAIPFSYHSPHAYLETNVKGTLNVLQAARELGSVHVVHTSTSEVYGTAVSVPISEDHPLQGQSPYAATKIGADQLAISFHRSFGLPVTVVRPFNTYGPRQSARAFIPAVITQIKTGIKQIKLGALHPTRDFNYITDTIDGFLASIHAAKAIGQVVNLGGGYEVSMSETVKLILEIMDRKDIEVISDDQRVRPPNSEVERLVADNRKAKKLLDWSPQYVGINGFRAGLKHTIDWFKETKNLSLYKPETYNV